MGCQKLTYKEKPIPLKVVYNAVKINDKGCAGVYRYGFNGQERSDEVYGKGNLNTALFWEYDTRLGRRWNLDPVVKVHETPYATFSNNPIWFVDPFGLDTCVVDNFGNSETVAMGGPDYEISAVGNLNNKFEATDKVHKGNISFTIEYQGQRRLSLSKSDRSKLHDKMYSQLGSYNDEDPQTLYDFYIDERIFGKSREQIVGQRKDRSLLFGSQPGGPFIRYIQDPINPSAVIDLRHMLIIGNSGAFIGNSLEMAQWAAGQVSGGNYQDYYSNHLGYQFYNTYSTQLKNNPQAFVEYLYEFLNSNQYGRLGPDGNINFYE